MDYDDNIYVDYMQNVEDNNLTYTGKKNWLYSEILQLIAAYSKHYKTPGQRKGQLYQKISDDLNNDDIICTSQQCSWKFAALKSSYTKYKDAQKPGNSGGTGIHFKFADEFDELFQFSHTQGLPKPASSSKIESGSASSSPPPSVILISDDDLTPVKKRRITVAETIENNFNKMQEVSSERHSQKMSILERLISLQERSVDENRELMNKLIDKL